MSYGRWNWEFSSRAWYCLHLRGLAIVEGICYMKLIVRSLSAVHEGVFLRVIKRD